MATLEGVVQKHSLLDGRDLSLSEMKTRYNLVGTSTAIRRICRIIDKVAAQGTTVLITGESGTGKELIANAIHINSPRASKPFVCVNCAAVHESLIESELFGHKKGAFTGAYSDKKGKFQLANKGSLFLDEIGELSGHAQAKLLRTIETGEVEMLGTEETEKVDVRIISATNKNVGTMVSESVFREDLLHRINVIEIYIPPLRDRPDDVLPLAYHFLEIFCNRRKIEMKRLTPSAEAVLLSHNWPGNVRELRNIIEKITVLVDSNDVDIHHISEFISFPYYANGLHKAMRLKEAKRSFEKSYIIHALWENNWNISRTAEALAIPRSSLYEKINEYQIKRILKNRSFG